MSTIQLDISDELAKKLAPYRDQLVELIELGLQTWLERKPQEPLAQQESLRQILAASGQVELPQPYTGQEPYVRRTPVPITGKPVSEVIIEQRESS